MNLKKYMMWGGVALTMGLGSCVGDLDLQPNDPNYVNPDNDPNFIENSLAMCYSGVTCSGYAGPGSSYVADIDAGTSAYHRMIFTLNEFCTDECIWIWTGDDSGSSGEITSSTWGSTNVYVKAAYYRLMGHIAICNQFLKNTEGASDAKTLEMRAQARVLRAYSYYNMCDLYGQSSFITDEDPEGTSPRQISRAELFSWIEKELTDIVDNKLISENPTYGQVGLDGAEALLARLLLNGEVFSGTPRWADCQKRCENIIARHQGGGFQNSGLANHYLYLFARDNNAYMPGGSNKAENEILFGFAYDADRTQSYGGPSFVIAATVANTHYIARQNYGCSGEWQCLRGQEEMAERFYTISDQDDRDDLWVRGVLPAGEDASGSWEAEDYQDRFQDFSGDWKTTGGNVIIKFTGRTRNDAADGGWNWNIVTGPDGKPVYNEFHLPIVNSINFPSTTFASTDQPVIRLADVYLMYTECNINGNVGDRQKALDYMNLVRARAGAPAVGFASLTKKGLLDERSRELYLESTRRPDLIRNGMFAGPTQEVWQYKGSLDNNEGTRIPLYRNLYPIPYAVIAAQPEFQQNPGY